MPRHRLQTTGNPYPNVTPQMWKDGERYVRILCDRYVRRLPSWVDRAGFESAALYALIATARIYDPAKGAFSTPLTIAFKHQAAREFEAQLNWYRGAAPSCRNYRGPECEGPLSLDVPLISEAGSARFGEMLVDERSGPEAVVMTKALLRQLIGRLLPTQRAVVQAIHFEGRSYRDVAEMLGCSRQGAYNMHRRALNSMRREAEALGVEAALDA